MRRIAEGAVEASSLLLHAVRTTEDKAEHDGRVFCAVTHCLT
jgi:hypothetical protein